MNFTHGSGFSSIDCRNSFRRNSDRYGERK
jgi:hypothetical protein